MFFSLGRSFKLLKTRSPLPCTIAKIADSPCKQPLLGISSHSVAFSRSCLNKACSWSTAFMSTRISCCVSEFLLPNYLAALSIFLELGLLSVSLGPLGSQIAISLVLIYSKSINKGIAVIRVYELKRGYIFRQFPLEQAWLLDC